MKGSYRIRPCLVSPRFASFLHQVRPCRSRWSRCQRRWSALVSVAVIDMRQRETRRCREKKENVSMYSRQRGAAYARAPSHHTVSAYPAIQPILQWPFHCRFSPFTSVRFPLQKFFKLDIRTSRAETNTHSSTLDVKISTRKRARYGSIHLRRTGLSVVSSIYAQHVLLDIFRKKILHATAYKTT